MSIIKNFLEKIDKSLRSFTEEDDEKSQTDVNSVESLSDEEDISSQVDNDESYIPPSGTVKSFKCSTCKDQGCCFLCNRPDSYCDLIGCSDRSCQKWLHQCCDNLTAEDAAKIKIYYCPICREEPKCRKWVMYKTSELKTAESTSEGDIENLPVNPAENPNFGEIQNLETQPSNEKLKNPDASLDTYETPLAETCSTPVIGSEETSNDENGKISLDSHDVNLLNKTSVNETEKTQNINFVFDSSTGKHKTLVTIDNMNDAYEMGVEREAYMDLSSELSSLSNDSISSASSNPQPSIMLNDSLKSKSQSNEPNKIVNLMPDNKMAESDAGKLISSTPTKYAFIPNFNGAEMSTLIENDVESQPITPGQNNKSVRDISLIKASLNENTKLNDLVTLLRTQLKTSYGENQKLREKIRNMQENPQPSNISPVKEKEINDLKIANTELQYDVNEKVELIKSLEEKLEQLNERFQIVNDKCVEMDKEIQQNEQCTMEKRHPKAVVNEYEKLRRLYNVQCKQINGLTQQNDYMKTTIDKKTGEIDQLKSQIRTVTRDDIQKKILCMVLDDNQKLAEEAQTSRRKMLSLKEEFINGEREMQKEMHMHLEEITKRTTKEADWETLSDDSGNDYPQFIKVISKSKKRKNRRERNKSSTSDNEPPKTLPPTYGDPNFGNPHHQFSSRVYENSHKKAENDTYKRGNNFFAPQPKPICKFYMEGRCKFNERCFNRHPNPTPYNMPYQPPFPPAPIGFYPHLYPNRPFHPPIQPHFPTQRNNFHGMHGINQQPYPTPMNQHMINFPPLNLPTSNNQPSTRGKENKESYPTLYPNLHNAPQ